jgi:hypothetical protein
MPTLQQIRTEIDTDPKSLGYATLKLQNNANEAVAAKLNQVGSVPADTIFKSYVPIEDVIAAIVRSDYDALPTAAPAAARTFLNEVLLKGTRVKSGDSNLRASMTGVFASGTTTRNNLVALASRAASRAEFLWGEGTVISDTQVSEALALP